MTAPFRAALLRDVIVVAPSVEADSVELIAARVDDGRWMIQRTRRNGADLAVHAHRLWRFFNSALRQAANVRSAARADRVSRGWPAAGRRPRASIRTTARSVQEMRARLAALLRDERLFHERIEQWSGFEVLTFLGGP